MANTHPEHELLPLSSYEDTFSRICQGSSPQISTGILSLDRMLNGGLSNELYVLCAETGTGKSALANYIAEDAADQGVNVLYFSLEMGRSEFVARGISRLSFMANLSDKACRKVTVRDILYQQYNDESKEFHRLSYSEYEKFAAAYFRRYGDHLYIIEGGIGNMSAADIARTAKAFRETNKDTPALIIVDYLQILGADSDDRAQADRKTKTDCAVRTLKALASQDGGMPVIALSSINRGSYGSRVTTSSSKESGDTECTSGILLGWNWDGVTDTKDPTAAAHERERCLKTGYRRMSLDNLKNRNGILGQQVRLVYFPAYNCFFDEDSWPDHLTPNPFRDWEGKSLRTLSRRD